MTRKSASDHAHMLLDDMQGDPALAQALGDMLITWAAAERAMLEALEALAEMPRGTAYVMFFRIPTFESRTKILQALAANWTCPKFPEHVGVKPFTSEEVAHCITKLGKLSTTRNGWVHASWTYSPHQNQVFVIDHREDVNSPQRRRPTKVADVQNHIDAVKKWTKRLREASWWIAGANQFRERPPLPTRWP